MNVNILFSVKLIVDQKVYEKEIAFNILEN